jgi:hypothetical protein
MLVDVFPVVSRQNGGSITNGFFSSNGTNVYWENCTYRTVTMLIFFTAKAVKRLGKGFLFKILKKCEAKLSQKVA